MTNLPKGTILTVPVECNIQGWSDYLPYALCNQSCYAPSSLVRAGSIKLTFGIEPENEYWKAWDSVRLDYCDDLKTAVSLYIQNMPFDKVRDIWETAFNNGRLPDIERYIRIHDEGGLIGDGNTKANLQYPMMEHKDNFLKPIGLGTPTDVKETLEPSNTGYFTDIPAKYIYLVQRVNSHEFKDTPTMYQIGAGMETYPSYVTMKVMVNTVNHFSGIPATHKYIIKD